MLQTFRAILKGNSIEWLDDAPELGNQSITVHITVLEEKDCLDSATRGQRMAEVLKIRLRRIVPFQTLIP